MGEYTIDIMQHMVRNEEVKKKLKEKYDNGRLVHKKIDDTKRLTGGTLFEANHILLDNEVLALRKSKEDEKANEKEGLIQKSIAKYNSM